MPSRNRGRHPRAAGGAREINKRTRRASQLWAGSEGVISALEVTSGVVEIGRSAAPKDTSDRMYNAGGVLYWDGKDLTASGGVTTLGALDDVDTTGVVTADILIYDGANWADQSLSGDVTISSLGVTAIADGAVDTTQIATDAVDDTKVDWGAGENQVNGMGMPLGDPADLSLTKDFKGQADKDAMSLVGQPWNNETLVTNAVDDLNEVLGLLVPAKPVDLGVTSTLSVLSEVGSGSPKLCDTVPDNTSGGTTQTPGSTVTRRTTDTSTTSTVGDAYNGESGVVMLRVDDVSADTQAMTAGNNDKATGQLRISDNKWFDTGEAVTGSNSGFWQSYDAKGELTGVSAVGVHRVRLEQTTITDTDTNDAYFCRDDMTSSPVLTINDPSNSVSQTTEGTVTKSSGIKHYTSGGTLTVDNHKMTNVSKTHYRGNDDPYFIDDVAYTHLGGSGTGSSISSATKSYANILSANQVGGIVNYNVGATAVSLDSLTVVPGGTNTFSTRQLRGLVRNVNGNSSTVTYSNAKILVKNGTVPTYLPSEDAVKVETGLGSGSGDGVRIYINSQTSGDNDGDSPSLTNWTSGGDEWNSDTAISTKFNAALVGGVIRHDATNYGDGSWFPTSQTNLSTITGRSGDIHYITFRFNRSAVSKFDIYVVGDIHTTDGCEVALPGSVVDTSASATNGWITPTAAFDNEGGAPIRGCGLGTVMPSNPNGRYTVSFGTASSTNATDNAILVRFKLASGDKITQLRFRVASN